MVLQPGTGALGVVGYEPDFGATLRLVGYTVDFGPSLNFVGQRPIVVVAAPVPTKPKVTGFSGPRRWLFRPRVVARVDVVVPVAQMVAQGAIRTVGQGHLRGIAPVAASEARSRQTAHAHLVGVLPQTDATGRVEEVFALELLLLS